MSTTQRLANFLLSYRSTPHATTGCTPISLFLKRELRTRLDLLKPSLSDQVIQKQTTQSDHHNVHARMREFDIGQAVMIRNFRGQPKWLPGEIVQKNGPLSYVVKTQTGLSWKRHVDHLKERLGNGQSQTCYEDSNAFVDLPVPQPAQ